VSGDRDGLCVLWDLNAGKQSRKLTGHKGHITASKWCNFKGFMDGLVVTGAQDGYIKIWDPRSHIFYLYPLFILLLSLHFTHYCTHHFFFFYLFTLLITVLITSSSFISSLYSLLHSSLLLL